MKRYMHTILILFTFVLTFSLYGEAIKVPIYKNNSSKSPVPVEQVGFLEQGKYYYFIFKLRPETSSNFSIYGIYIFTDNDNNTGRKGMGNEYYLAPPKTKFTYYKTATQSLSAYKAVATHKIGDILFITTRIKDFTEKPLKDFKFTIVSNKGKIYVKVNPKNKKSEINIKSLPATKLTATKKQVVSSKKKSFSHLNVSRKGFKDHGNVAVWIEDAAFRIKGASDYTANKKLSLIGAGNEKEDFQLGIWFGKKARGGIKISWSDFTDSNGNRISKNRLTMYHVKPMLFMEPESAKNKYKIRLWGKIKFLRKHIYDLLVPYLRGSSAGDYKGAMNKSFNLFWGYVHIPSKVVPGKYKGELKVVVPGQIFKFPVHLKVINFVLPERPSFTMFAAMPRSVNYYSSIFKKIIAGGHPSGITLNYEKALKNLAEHRVALRDVSINPSLKFNSSGEPEIDFSDFDRIIKYILDDLKMNTKLATPFAGVSWGHGSRYVTTFGSINFDSISEEFKTKYVKTLKKVAKHLKDKGWMDYFFAYFSDEPAKEQVEQTKTLARLIKKADPDFVPWYYGGGPTKQYMDVINTWMGGYGMPLEEGEGNFATKDIEEAIKRGDRIGVYNPWEAYLMNIPIAYTRTLYWWAYKQNLFWMSMYCIGYFNNTAPGDITNAGYWKLWVYPPATKSKTGTWNNSVRWEMTRKGLEDYEYLKGVEKLTAKLIMKLPKDVKKVISPRSIAMEYANAVAYDCSMHLADGDKLLEVKKALANEIESISKLPLGAVHYKRNFKGINLFFIGEPGTKIKFSEKEYSIDSKGILTLTLPADKNKSITVNFSKNGKSKKVVKQIFKPFAISVKL